MDFLAFDIGGANLKIADGRGFAASRPFALFRNPQALAQELRTLLAEAPPSDHLLVTMTGELADCFASRSEGVRAILDAVATAADGRHTRVYRNDGKMVTPQIALRDPSLTSAANWHALGRFCGRYAPEGTALLLDVGSTTCDVIPLVNGQVAARGTSDTQRLLTGELVYTGAERSPVCGLVSHVPYRDGTCPVAQELFATTRDVYLLLAMLPEEPTSVTTADGRPATKAAARARLGRSICATEDEFNHKDAVAMARAIAQAQRKLFATAIRQVVAGLPAPPQKVVLAGQGEYLAIQTLDEIGLKLPMVSLAREIEPSVSRAAPAHALAVLAREALHA
jgi:probable H4MPT-linked C1 transfer pathway protein